MVHGRSIRAMADRDQFVIVVLAMEYASLWLAVIPIAWALLAAAGSGSRVDGALRIWE